MKAIFGIVGGLLVLIIAFVLIWIFSGTGERMSEMPTEEIEEEVTEESEMPENGSDEARTDDAVENEVTSTGEMSGLNKQRSGGIISHMTPPLSI